MSRAAALIVAAGRGSRAATAGRAPKQYVLLGGVSILGRAISQFAGHPAIGLIQVVIHPDDEELYRQATAGFAGRLAPPVTGGATRQASVRAGLAALATAAPELVLIHDAARPFVDQSTIDRVIDALAVSPGAIAAVRVADTLKRADGAGLVAGTVDRQGLWRAQTPQGFQYAAIAAAHAKAAAAGLDDLTDDAAVAEWAGLPVRLVEASSRNIKLTTAEDLAMAEEMLRPAPVSARRICTGQGFDVHRFTLGDHVWLGGINIPHSHALEGHSDADVALHALTDALLGAIGDGDIGQHFPPSDPRWKGAPSHLFLADAAARVRARGGRILNVDLTLLCEAPRIGPHRHAMQARIGEILELPSARVGVKATTTEGLGFTGRREGIAAMAIASVELPDI